MSSPPALDQAAVFAVAISLWKECQKHAATNRSIDLSGSYAGIDGFMREIMRIAKAFETWACQHVDFTKLSDVWPYLLQDRFGQECFSILLPQDLADFDEHDCQLIARRLNLSTYR